MLDRGRWSHGEFGRASLGSSSQQCEFSIGNAFPETLAPAGANRRAIRRLLVPLDGTSFAEHALPHALAIARRTSASLILTLVQSVVDPEETDPWKRVADVRIRSEKQRYLQDVLSRVNCSASIPVTGILIESDEIASNLCRVAENVDLVIMAGHVRRSWAKLWHRSIADSVMRNLACPMLLVRGYDAPVHLTADPSPRHILVPLDRSPFSEEALAPAVSLADICGSEVTLVHVQNLDSELTGCSQYMRDLVRRLASRGRRITASVIASNLDIASVLVSFAEDRQAEMIALATHWPCGLERLRRGSVAEAIVRKAQTPVLLFRPSLPQSRNGIAQF